MARNISLQAGDHHKSLPRHPEILPVLATARSERLRSCSRSGATRLRVASRSAHLLARRDTDLTDGDRQDAEPVSLTAYRALLLILYCTGLRTGEALRLRIRDVDLGEKVLHVEVSKAKSRWVPFEETLAKELTDYLRQRRLISEASEDSRFLVQSNGSPFGRTIVSNRISVLIRQAGMKPRRGRLGPRPYDTRHTFAVNRLTEWYREGVDIQERLAWLSAYLGHDDLLGTQDYLHLTPELRRIVSTRQEDYIRRCWDSEGR